MIKRNLGRKENELFNLFAKVVREMGGTQVDVLPDASPLWREAKMSLEGLEFNLSVGRYQSDAFKEETDSGMLAGASLKCGNQTVAEFKLHTQEWVWKVQPDPSKLLVVDVDAETVRTLLELACQR